EVGFNKIYYLPFYRYAAYSNQIGFREMILAAIGKQTTQMEQGGYLPLYDHTGQTEFGADPSELLGNKYYDEIRKICAEHNMKLTVITTPICDRRNSEAFFDRLRVMYPEIHH